ncbi:hypothetical protein [Microbacterium stercoris]|uniref:Uncharacterized protein n=1 Tax=Microbacterium stercoris TaxID=2820289 RepID=A0A939TTB0_9MICO|nr:hypothetical protein [Microbacterium stercoris]MBO3662789.1 hypothetical protein [Microbacterium stercoris]
MDQPSAITTPRRAASDLILLGVVFVLLAAAIWAGFSALHRQFWGPSAFVERYLATLAEGDTAAAVAFPGVAVDTTDLEGAGLPDTASDALLRPAVVTWNLTDVEIVGEKTSGDVTEVTASYELDGADGETTFRVRPAGMEGLVPRWGFETSPLAEIEVAVRGSRQFSVNGFEIDQRQVSPLGPEADPLEPVSMLVLTPGVYSVSVDTSIAAAPPVTVMADAPLGSVPIELQATPTAEFADVVTQKVSDFLAQCATQKVLQPTGCPFGTPIEDRVLPDTIQWSIITPPPLTMVPDGAFWALSPSTGTAHLEADVRALSTGYIYRVSKDVPFVIDGTVEILPDGTASILVGSPDLR